MKIKIIMLSLMGILGTAPFFPLYSMHSDQEEMQSTESSSQNIPEILARRDAKRLVAMAMRLKHRAFMEPSPESIDFVLQYKKLLEDYRQYEDNLPLLKSMAEASFDGTNYAMTLEEIKQKIKEKFVTMKSRGLIVSKEEFEKIKGTYFDKPTPNLTRIWGAEYLKSKINESPELQDKYDVPNYVIVAEDPNHLEINVWFGNDLFPIANSLKNASLYFENIVGTRVASWRSSMVDDIGRESGIGFDDFSDPGNIIRDSKSGKNYIVDTEFKSFKFSVATYLRPMLAYAQKRFRYLNNTSLIYTYIINLDH